MGTGGCKVGGEKLPTEDIFDSFNIHFKKAVYIYKKLTADVFHQEQFHILKQIN